MDEADDARAHIRRLHWRCRRGMLELDLLLERFLRRHYPHASPEERRDFDRLLHLPDQTLFAYFLQGERPDDPGLERLVRRILQHH